jgi:hypothetical protein
MASKSGRVVVKVNYHQTRFKNKSRRQKVKRVKPPRPVPPPKPPRPRSNVLRKIYRNLITSDLDQRVDALSKAMHWYDTVQTYLNHKQEGKWTIPQLRARYAAERSRTTGIDSSVPAIKEKVYLKTIRSFEKAFKVFKPPSITRYLSKLKTTRGRLEKRKNRLANKYGEFLGLLEKVVAPKNSEDKRIELRVDRIKSQYRIDSEGNITLDRKLVELMRRNSRKFGLFTPINQILPILSEAAGRMPEIDSQGFKTGRMLISWKKRHNALLEISNTVNRYFTTKDSSRKLIRRPRDKEDE